MWFWPISNSQAKPAYIFHWKVTSFTILCLLALFSITLSKCKLVYQRVSSSRHNVDFHLENGGQWPAGPQRTPTPTPTSTRAGVESHESLTFWCGMPPICGENRSLVLQQTFWYRMMTPSERKRGLPFNKVCLSESAFGNVCYMSYVGSF